MNNIWKYGLFGLALLANSWTWAQLNWTEISMVKLPYQDHLDSLRYKVPKTPLIWQAVQDSFDNKVRIYPLAQIPLRSEFKSLLVRVIGEDTSHYVLNISFEGACIGMTKTSDRFPDGRLLYTTFKERQCTHVMQNGSRRSWTYKLIDREGKFVDREFLVHYRRTAFSKSIDNWYVRLPKGLELQFALSGKLHAPHGTRLHSKSYVYAPNVDRPKAVVIARDGQELVDARVLGEPYLDTAVVPIGAFYTAGRLSQDETNALSREDVQSLEIGDSSTYSPVDLSPSHFLIITEISEATYRNTAAAFVEEHPDLLTLPYEKQDSIVLNFKDGSRKVFADTAFPNMEYSPTLHYQLLKGHRLKGDQLLYSTFFEDYAALWYDGESGNLKYSFIGFPFVSPNGRYILSIASPFSYEGGGMILELLVRDEGGLHRAWQMNVSGYTLPDSIQLKWVNEREILLKTIKGPQKPSEGESSNFLYHRIQLFPYGQASQ